MRTYIDIIFTPDSAGPAELISAMSKIGLKPIFGSHDLMIEWDTEREFKETFKKVEKVLKSLRVSYRLQTFENPPESVVPIAVLMPEGSEY